MTTAPETVPENVWLAVAAVPDEESVALMVKLHAPAAVGVAPIFRERKWKFFDQLSQEEQVEVLKSYSKSDNYLLRQVGLIIKTTGALSHVATTRFHQHVNKS